MRTRFRTAALATLLLSAGAGDVQAQGGGAPAHPSVTLPAELQRVLRDYERAWAAGDAAALGALFHEDGFALPQRRMPARGRAAIRAQYPNTSGELQLRAIAYAVDDTIGYIVGMFSYPGQRDVGKFLLALRRSTPGARWLIAADMDNPNPGPGGTP